MSFNDYVRSSKRSKLLFYLWYLLFIFNDKILKRSRLEPFLWERLKCQLFYVAGKCQHSGNCCKNLMLVRHGKTISTATDWKKLIKKDTSYRRFLPNYKKDKKTITNFSCTCLTPQQFCNDYKNRPHFCKTYPLSTFIQDGHIPDHCGYYIQRSTLRPTITNSRLLSRIQAMRNKNRVL